MFDNERTEEKNLNEKEQGKFGPVNDVIKNQSIDRMPRTTSSMFNVVLDLIFGNDPQKMRVTA